MEAALLASMVGGAEHAGIGISRATHDAQPALAGGAPE